MLFVCTTSLCTVKNNAMAVVGIFFVSKTRKTYSSHHRETKKNINYKKNTKKIFTLAVLAIVSSGYIDLTFGFVLI